MQKRLMRSQTDTMLAGVCGGLADYFLIDPVIVRLIFVLITITTGLGILFYPILWLVMPKAPLAAGTLPQYQPGWQQAEAGTQQAEVGQYAEQQSRMYVGAGAQSRPSSYGSYAGMAPSTGETGYLGGADTSFSTEERRLRAPAHSRTKRRFGWGGFVLIGLGLMMLSEYFHISTEFVFPLILIIVGALLVFRR